MPKRSKQQGMLAAMFEPGSGLLTALARGGRRPMLALRLWSVKTGAVRIVFSESAMALYLASSSVNYPKG
jgi:hypothetical protein